METFYLPNFILDDSEHEETAAAGPEERQSTEDLFFARPLPAGSNPWEEKLDLSPKSSDFSGTAPAAMDLPPGLAALIHAPPPSHRAVAEPEALLSPTSLDSPTVLTRNAISTSAVISDGDAAQAPPGFEGVAQLSPRTPQGSRLEETPLLPTAATAASELTFPASGTRATDSHIDWGRLVPSMLQGPQTMADNDVVRDDLLQPSLAAAATAAGASARSRKPRPKGRQSNKEGAKDKKKERQVPTPNHPQPKQKSWASVAVTATPASTAHGLQGPAFARQQSLGTGSRHSASSSSSSLAPTRTNVASPARRQNPKTHARTLTATPLTATPLAGTSGGKGATTAQPSNRSHVRRHRNRSFGSAASDDPWPDGDELAQESSQHASAAVTEPAAEPETTGPKPSSRAAKKVTAKRADKREDDMDDDRSSSLTDSQSNVGVADIGDAIGKESNADNQYTTWIYTGIESVTGAIEWVRTLMYTVVACVWPVVSSFGMLFAFVAKALIIFALGLANTFRYAAVEVEQSESGSFFCYMVFYVVPNACDFIMSLFSLPQFTPHVLSSFALYCLCHQSTAGSRRKTYRGKSSGDPQAEASCKAILQCFRYSIPFDMFLEGFSQPNMAIMMLDVPSRLLLAYVLSLLRANLILSPVAWVCWSVQVLMSVYLPYNKLTECLLLLVGLASVRLCTVIQAIEVVSTKEV